MLLNPRHNLMYSGIEIQRDVKVKMYTKYRQYRNTACIEVQMLK